MIALALTLSLTATIQDAPVGPVPTDDQAAWFRQARHLVVRAGLEDLLATSLEEYDPAAFQAASWVELAKAAGFPALVLEVRDKAGFCLWDSGHTGLDVGATPYRQDLVAPLASACEAAGLRFGVAFASVDPETIAAQVDELLVAHTNLAWVGFPADATGLDSAALVARVRAAVPGALVAVPAGGDVRRVPSGVLVRDEADGAWRLPLTEAELPRQSEDLEQLLLDTLGQGANLGLIVRPAPDGSVGEATAQRLADLHDNLAAILDVDLVRAAEVQASHTHSEAHGAANVQDGDPLSAWMVPGDVRRCFLTCAELPRTVLDTIVLAEPLERGACITSYRLQGLRDNLWLDLHVGDRIGPRRVLRVDPSDYQSLRLIVTDATAAPAIASIEAYAAPPRVHIEAEEQVFLGGTRVRFFTSHPSAVVRYTLDGSEPTRASSLYRRALDLDQSCVVTARAFTGDEPGQYSATLRLRAYTYATLAAPVPSEPTTAGLRTRVWDGPWRDLDQVPWEREPVVDRTVETIGPDGNADHEGAVQRFDGYVRAHKDGIYGFFSPGAGHVRVYLGDDLVLESFTGLDRVGEVGLQAGWHPLRIELIRAGALRTSTVQWRGPSLSKRPFLPRELRRD